MRTLLLAILIVLAALSAHNAGWITLPENLTGLDGTGAPPRSTVYPPAGPDGRTTSGQRVAHDAPGGAGSSYSCPR